MKLHMLALVTGLLSTTALAGDLESPIENVDVFKTEDTTLSVQNLSFEDVEIDIYGEEFTLKPLSGLTYDCAGYTNLELQFKNNLHEYFEVPCQSRVVINEAFKNRFKQGQ